MATLYTEFSTQAIDENKISASDKRTFAYICEYGDIIYDAVLAEETDWQVFHNLSELRKGILSWYDFPVGASVLEVGAGFGTLTGCLCRKCAQVTATDRSAYRARAISARYAGMGNLDVYAGDVTGIEFPGKFDYIIIIGLLERAGGGSPGQGPYAAYLRFLKKWLNPGGTLLFAVENRYGLRYFCGEAEPHTGRAFDGLNQYLWGTPGRSFSRKEAADIAREAGFGHHKFYYPLPDYKLPQLIYTDAYLPEKNLKERLIPYYRNTDTLVAPERELYDDIVSNGVFPFFANSFLVECRIEGEPEQDGIRAEDGINTAEGTGGRREALSANLFKASPDTKKTERTRPGGQVLYAAVSTDRGAVRGYATTVCSGGIARKAPLYEEGRPNARKLYSNILDLQAHGIPVVRHRLLEGDVLEMPYIPWPTLSNYIKETMGHDEEKFLGLLDRIYAYILKSSEQVPAEENALPAALGLWGAGSGHQTAPPGMGNARESTEATREQRGGEGTGSGEEQGTGENTGTTREQSRREGTGSVAGQGTGESTGTTREQSRGEGAGSVAEQGTVGQGDGGNPGGFGPILKKAYMELIPLNCFYHPDTGNFLYFDQEFVRENYPAKYVLFRAIHYIYCFTPNAEQYYPKKKLLQRYGMEDTWDIYLREEARFLDEVRNREQYRLFYQKTEVDRNRMLENIRRLETGNKTNV